eukprot:525680-Pleurochrysis_carterae.AAC.1
MRLQPPKSAACDAHHSCHGQLLEKAGRHRPCLCSARASSFVVSFAYWILVVCREAKARPARSGRKAS